MEDIKRRTRSYSSEFKQEAIKLALSTSSPISATAKGLGIPVATLHSWIHSVKLNGKYAANADDNINVAEVLAENKSLRI